MMRISIISTVLNGAGTIRDCLNSINRQSDVNVEHIVVDGGSNDGTRDILTDYRHKISVVITEPDSGIYDGMNKGFAAATGDIIGILNADDIFFHAGVLKRIANIFEKKQVDSCYGDLIYVDGKTAEQQAGRIARYWKSGKYDLKKFYWGWMPPHPTFFVKRDIYDKYGYFNLELGTAADYELMLRLLVKYRVSCAYLPEILVQMRSGGASNVTLKTRLRANRMDRKAWVVNGLKPYPWTVLFKPLRKLGQWISKPPAW